MAEASYPFENTDVTESQFSAWAAALAGTGVVSGLAVAPQSGMNIALASGEALVRGVYYANDATKTLAVSAAPAAGNTRQDYVVLHLDTAANTVTAEVKAGTANTSGGVLPSLVQTATEWEHPIAKVTVAAGTAAITGGMLVALNHDQGRSVYTWTVATAVPTPSAPVALGFNRTDKTWWLWNGSTWSQFGNTIPWESVTGKPATFPPTTPVDAATVNGRDWDHGTGLPASGDADGDVFYLHA